MKTKAYAEEFWNRFFKSGIAVNINTYNYVTINLFSYRAECNVYNLLIIIIYI